MQKSVSTLWNYLVLKAVSIAEVSALSCALPEQWAACSEQGQWVTVTALCLEAEHSSSQAEAADLWMESVWMWDAAVNQLWPDAEHGCPPSCGAMPKSSSVAQASPFRVSVKSARLAARFIKSSACWQQPHVKIEGSPSHQIDFAVGVSDTPAVGKYLGDKSAVFVCFA